ncbi:MAG TPA: hypothetical protein VK919_10015, partial [Solirubrobacterales bacterium]|nr:hypothetical protein [Solirubrobacterales bacterium]
SRVPVRVRRPAPADRTAALTSAEGTEDVSTVSPTPARTRSATGSAPARAPAAAAPDVSASRPAFTTRPAVPIVARQAARAAPPPPEPPPPATGPDIDELYEQFAERLRRELLLERERIGDLLGDLHR